MKLLSRALLTCGCLLLGAGAYAADPSARSPMQTERHYEFKSTKSAKVGYLLYVPKAAAEDSSRKWPLMMFLHGAGERGSNLSLVAKHGPPKLINAGKEFPFIVVSPQCPEGQIWSTEVLLGLLDSVIAEQPVDTRRVYLTGLSMGGYGTWALGTLHPDRFAAVAPICGGGEFITTLLASANKGAALRSLGVWAFHGARDSVVPVNESERMVGFLKARGLRDIQLTVYPNADHDSWTETYNNPELYEWFLQHRRD